MFKGRPYSRPLPLLIAFIAASANAVVADEVADFYRGKTIQVIIPSTMGGSVGLYGKLAADHLGAHIPGKPTIITSQMPGAGGLQAVEYMLRVAPRDGSVIGEVLSPSLLVPLLQESRFDAKQLYWLGSLTPRPAIVAVWHKAKATTLEGAKKVELTMGSTGLGSGNYWIPTLANALVGTKFKLITGYRGGAGINLAIERGEVDGRSNYWTGWTTAKPEWVKEGKLKFLFRTGPKAADMPPLPAFVDLVEGEGKKMVQILDAPDEIGVGFYVGPGLPAKRAAALRSAFAAMIKEAGFLAEAARLQAPIEHVSGERLQEVVASIYDTPPSVVQRLRKIIKP